LYWPMFESLVNQQKAFTICVCCNLLMIHQTGKHTLNPNSPLEISLNVGASLLANFSDIFASKLAPTMGWLPNGQSGLKGPFLAAVFTVCLHGMSRF
jgi:hypothetical protein